MRYLFFKDLQQNFQIENTSSALKVIAELQNPNKSKNLTNHLLIKIYLQVGSKIIDTPLQDIYTNPNIEILIKDLTTTFYTNSKQHENELTEKLTNQIWPSLKQNQVRNFFSLLQYMQNILPYMADVKQNALDLLNALRVIHYSFYLEYLNENQACKLWQQTTEIIFDEFKSYPSFFASLITYNQQDIYSNNYNDILLDQTHNPLIQRVINLILAPNRILKSQSNWPVDDLFELLEPLEYLQKQDHCNSNGTNNFFSYPQASQKQHLTIQQYNNSILAYQKIFLPISCKYGVESYFAESLQNGEFYKAGNLEIEQEDFLNRVRNFTKRHKIKLSPNQSVLFAFNSALFTDTCVYLSSKKLFFSKVKKIKWKDIKIQTSVDFTCNYLVLKVNKVKITEILLDPSRVNYTKSLTDLEKHQVKELFKKDFIGIKKTFKEFKEIVMVYKNNKKTKS
ncbi:hypothetical protein ACYSNV_11515 [Myroides sp. LJL119]